MIRFVLAILAACVVSLVAVKASQTSAAVPVAVAAFLILAVFSMREPRR